MNTPLDHIDESCLEEVLAHDLNRDSLQRLADIARRLEAEPALAKRLDELAAVRHQLQSSVDGLDESPLGEGGAFVQRMVKAIEGVSSDPSRPSRRGHLGPGLVGGALAAVLTLAGLTSLGLLGGGGGSEKGSSFVAALDGPLVVGESSQWLPAVPDEQRALLADLSGFYDNRAGWIATTGSDTQIGLSAHPIASAKPWVTRLSLTSPTGEILTTDLALFAGQDVVLFAPRSDASAVRYAVRLNRDPSGDGASLAIAAEFTEGASLSTTLRIENAGAQEIGRLRTEYGDYVLHLGLDSPHVYGAI
ncbi:MAG: hypothetical protein AAF086_03320 [Planctomycetota bacterium]